MADFLGKLALPPTSISLLSLSPNLLHLSGSFTLVEGISSPWSHKMFAVTCPGRKRRKEREAKE